MTISVKELGLPIPDWRYYQEQVVLDVLDALDRGKKFVVVNVPAGVGKSVIGVAVMRMARALGLASRTAYKVGTKALQAQMEREFGMGEGKSDGMKKVMGRGAYTCTGLTKAFKVGQFAPSCEAGRWNCSKVNDLGVGGCPYSVAYNVAQLADEVLMNYSLAIAHARLASGNGANMAVSGFGLDVMDEAHMLDTELAGALGTELVEGEYPDRLGGKEDVGMWREWGKREWVEVRKEISRLKGYEGSHEYTLLLERERKVRELAGMNEENWVVEWEPKDGGKVRPGSVRFDPVYVGVYRGVLFPSPFNVLMSGTIKPKTMGLVGVRGEEYEYLEYEDVFEWKRNPVWWVPTVRLRGEWAKMLEGDKMTWVRRIDNIIEPRVGVGRGGLVHTHSYERADYLVGKSSHSKRMIGGRGKRNTQEAVGEYRRRLRRGEAVVLVGPGLTTGFDFPHDECRFNIIGKVPFPSSQSKVMKRRLESDKGYLNYLTMRTLQQASRRGSRSVEDWCETFIVDDMVGWFMGQNRDLAQKWFRVERAGVIPKPLSVE